MKRFALLLLLCSMCSAAVKGNGTNGAMIFGDGSGACGHCLPQTTSYSILYWIKVTGTSIQRYVSLFTTEVGTGADAQTQSTTTQHYLCGNFAGGSDTVDLGALATGTWHAIACTWDGTNLRGYLDGVLIGTIASTHVGGSTAGLPSLFTFQSTPSNFGNDTIAEYSLFNNAPQVLTLNEIKSFASGRTISSIQFPTFYSPLWGTGYTSNSEPDLSGCLQTPVCGGFFAGHEMFGVYQTCTIGCITSLLGVSIVDHAPVQPFSPGEEEQGY